MRKWFIICTCLAVVMVTFSGTNAYAAAFFISPAGADKFNVMVSDLAGAGAIDLTIYYDKMAYRNPRAEWASWASGGMAEKNISVPGTIRMVVMSTSPLNSTGPVAAIASISFDRIGTNSPIPSLKVSLVSTNANLMPATVVDAPAGSDSVTTPPVVTETNSPPVQDTTKPPADPIKTTTPSTITPATISGPTYLGGVTTLQPSTPEEKPKTDTTPQREIVMPLDTPAVASAPEEKREPETAASTAASKEGEKSVSYKSVLQRFKEFEGERTIKAYTALFAVEGPPGFTQTPPIAVADGIATVVLTVGSGATDQRAPNFALKGAKIITLKSADEGVWVVEAKPEKGVVAAILTVIRGNGVAEYPLTVTPPVDLKTDKSDTAVSEADFSRFLKERGSVKGPKFDLNDDGKRDYVDDYIYTANYLIAMKKVKTKGK